MASASWNWQDVGIVWRDALPSHLRSRCVPVENATGNATLWRPDVNALSTPPGSLWANEVALTTAALDEVNVAPHSAPAVMSGRWVEVSCEVGAA